MKENLETFRGRHHVAGIEEDYDGLFWLLSIAKEPSQEIINEAADKLFNFITN
jgi:hypothetical protein